nr:unnamed protein product [Callosobruchus chinensis]
MQSREGKFDFSVTRP